MSNCDAGYIEAFLESSNLSEYFDDFLAASKHNITKSEAIKRIIEKNFIKSAVYVGDTLRDLVAAKHINIDFIQAKYGFGEDLESKYSINKITELPELLENMEYIYSE